jgi:threonine/homoserine/homoserine lactone efflux protein
MVLIIYGLITYFDKENKKQVEESEELVNIPIKNNYLKLFLKGYFLNFINIGVLTFWLGLVLLIGPSLDMSRTAIFSYFGFIILGYFLTDLAKIFLAKKLKDKMTPTLVYRIKRIMGIILIVCGVFLILKGFIPNEKINSMIKISAIIPQ